MPCCQPDWQPVYFALSLNQLPRSHSARQSTKLNRKFRSNGVSWIAIRHSGAANSVGSLSPRAATRVPQTRARVGEGRGEGRFCRVGRAGCTPHPAASRRPSPARGEGNGARGSPYSSSGSIWTERAVAALFSAFARGQGLEVVADNLPALQDKLHALQLGDIDRPVCSPCSRPGSAA